MGGHQNKIEKMDVENTLKGETNSAKENTVIGQDNSVEENSVVNETANEVENTALNNTTQNIVIHENVTPSQPAVTDKKQKAIELVKKECGNDKTVNYVFDYINENGEYVVAVKDKTSATVKYYFRVNLETETVELD